MGRLIICPFFIGDIMASWAIHFRIADWFLDKIPNLDKDYFIIGNIAPDCGVPLVGKRGYNPSGFITHRTNDGNKSDCDYDSIYSEFIKNESDIKRKSFYIGFFVHYMTDCFWAREKCIPIENTYGSFGENRKLSRAVKREWYNLDFNFFKNNISPSFELFKTYGEFNEPYPDFYKNNEITNRMEYIVSFYKSNEPVEMEYKYTNETDVEKFVLSVPNLIYQELQNRNVNL
jgi:hypothetical protein